MNDEERAQTQRMIVMLLAAVRAAYNRLEDNDSAGAHLILEGCLAALKDCFTAALRDLDGR
jgi:hypothetical protein